MYDFNDISILGLRNVLTNNDLLTCDHPAILTKESLITIANSALNNGLLDEIELILEESGE